MPWGRVGYIVVPGGSCHHDDRFVTDVGIPLSLPDSYDDVRIQRS